MVPVGTGRFATLTGCKHLLTPEGGGEREKEDGLWSCGEREAANYMVVLERIPTPRKREGASRPKQPTKRRGAMDCLLRALAWAGNSDLSSWVWLRPLITRLRKGLVPVMALGYPVQSR